MAARIFSAVTGNPFPSCPRRSLAAGGSVLLFTSVSPCRRSPSIIRSALLPWQQRRLATAVCFVTGQSRSSEITGKTGISDAVTEEEDERRILLDRMAEKMARNQSERRAYLMAAVMSSLGITSIAIPAIYYRFYRQMEGGEVPVTEMLGTFALSVGAAFWSGWVHRALWHASLWNMHESHHQPHHGAFELNDVSAIISAVPAISLLSVGFFNRGLLPDLCFGAELEEVGGAEESEKVVNRRIKLDADASG